MKSQRIVCLFILAIPTIVFAVSLAFLKEIKLKEGCPNCNLQGKAFFGEQWSEFNFSGANLSNADLSHAVCERANFVGTQLIKADVSSTNFRQVIMNASSVSQSVRSQKNGGGTKLNEALVGDADFSEADMADVDCTGIQGGANDVEQSNSAGM